MDLSYNLQNEFCSEEKDFHPFLYQGLSNISKDKKKVSQFTQMLGNILSMADNDDITVKKIVDTALTVEFSGNLTKDDYTNLFNVISATITANRKLKNQFLSLAQKITQDCNLDAAHKVLN